MDFAQDVGTGLGIDWKGIIFRRTYPELKDVIDKCLKWFPRIFPSAIYNHSDHVWTFDEGEQLLLRPFERDEDYNRYHGHAYPFIGWEELCNWATDVPYTSMFSCNRSANPRVAERVRVRATANAYGVGHNWVKLRFRLPIAPSKIIGDVIKDAVDRQGKPAPWRVAIRGYLRENLVMLHADPNYEQRLRSSARNESQLKAWVEDDWNVVAGGMFDDVWNPACHVVPDFPLSEIVIEKLRLNDSAFNFEPETSLALGYGFRCGFLGMLHLEIVQERLEREFNLSLIVTAPSVRFRVVTTLGETIEVENPAKLPPVDKIERIEEPYVRGSILVPTEFMSEIYKLAQDKRGEHKSLEYVGKRVHIQFDFPLSEIVVDFYDRLKSISKGYASFDYDFLEFRPSDMVKLDVLLNGDPVDALSVIVHREKSYEKGKVLTEKLRSVIPRQLYEVAIQAAIGSRVIARETVKAMGKNVTAKCYGGDISRKRKLLEKQKEGKKRMKQVGRVEVPQEAFLSVLKS
jgi:hypothetical protein